MSNGMGKGMGKGEGKGMSNDMSKGMGKGIDEGKSLWTLTWVNWKKFHKNVHRHFNMLLDCIDFSTCCLIALTI